MFVVWWFCCVVWWWVFVCGLWMCLRVLCMMWMCVVRCVVVIDVCWVLGYGLGEILNEWDVFVIIRWNFDCASEVIRRLRWRVCCWIWIEFCFCILWWWCEGIRCVFVLRCVWWWCLCCCCWRRGRRFALKFYFRRTFRWWNELLDWWIECLMWWWFCECFYCVCFCCWMWVRVWGGCWLFDFRTFDKVRAELVVNI